jgi:hypothetical protein
VLPAIFRVYQQQTGFRLKESKRDAEGNLKKEKNYLMNARGGWSEMYYYDGKAHIEDFYFDCTEASKNLHLLVQAKPLASASDQEKHDDCESQLNWLIDEYRALLPQLYASGRYPNGFDVSSMTQKKPATLFGSDKEESESISDLQKLAAQIAGNSLGIPVQGLEKRYQNKQWKEFIKEKAGADEYNMRELQGDKPTEQARVQQFESEMKKAEAIAAAAPKTADDFYKANPAAFAQLPVAKQDDVFKKANAEQQLAILQQQPGSPGALSVQRKTDLLKKIGEKDIAKLLIQKLKELDADPNKRPQIIGEIAALLQLVDDPVLIKVWKEWSLISNSALAISVRVELLEQMAENVEKAEKAKPPVPTTIAKLKTQLLAVYDAEQSSTVTAHTLHLLELTDIAKTLAGMNPTDTATLLTENAAFLASNASQNRLQYVMRQHKIANALKMVFQDPFDKAIAAVEASIKAASQREIIQIASSQKIPDEIYPFLKQFYEKHCVDNPPSVDARGNPILAPVRMGTLFDQLSPKQAYFLIEGLLRNFKVGDDIDKNQADRLLYLLKLSIIMGGDVHQVAIVLELLKLRFARDSKNLKLIQEIEDDFENFLDSHNTNKLQVFQTQRVQVNCIYRPLIEAESADAEMEGTNDSVLFQQALLDFQRLTQDARRNIVDLLDQIPELAIAIFQSLPVEQQAFILESDNTGDPSKPLDQPLKAQLLNSLTPVDQARVRTLLIRPSAPVEQAAAAQLLQIEGDLKAKESQIAPLQATKSKQEAEEKERQDKLQKLQDKLKILRPRLIAIQADLQKKEKKKSDLESSQQQSHAEKASKLANLDQQIQKLEEEIRDAAKAALDLKAERTTAVDQLLKKHEKLNLTGTNNSEKFSDFKIKINELEENIRLQKNAEEHLARLEKKRALYIKLINYTKHPKDLGNLDAVREIIKTFFSEDEQKVLDTIRTLPALQAKVLEDLRNKRLNDYYTNEIRHYVQRARDLKKQNAGVPGHADSPEENTIDNKLKRLEEWKKDRDQIFDLHEKVQEAERLIKSTQEKCDKLIQERDRLSRAADPINMDPEIQQLTAEINLLIIERNDISREIASIEQQIQTLSSLPAAVPPPPTGAAIITTLPVALRTLESERDDLLKRKAECVALLARQQGAKAAVVALGKADRDAFAKFTAEKQVEQILKKHFTAPDRLQYLAQMVFNDPNQPIATELRQYYPLLAKIMETPEAVVSMADKIALLVTNYKHFSGHEQKSDFNIFMHLPIGKSAELIEALYKANVPLMKDLWLSLDVDHKCKLLANPELINFVYRLFEMDQDPNILAEILTGLVTANEIELAIALFEHILKDLDPKDKSKGLEPSSIQLQRTIINTISLKDLAVAAKLFVGLNRTSQKEIMEKHRDANVVATLLSTLNAAKVNELLQLIPDTAFRDAVIKKLPAKMQAKLLQATPVDLEKQIQQEIQHQNYDVVAKLLSNLDIPKVYELFQPIADPNVKRIVFEKLPLTMQAALFCEPQKASFKDIVLNDQQRIEIIKAKYDDKTSPAFERFLRAAVDNRQPLLPFFMILGKLHEKRMSRQEVSQQLLKDIAAIQDSKILETILRELNDINKKDVEAIIKMLSPSQYQSLSSQMQLDFQKFRQPAASQAVPSAPPPPSSASVRPAARPPQIDPDDTWEDEAAAGGMPLSSHEPSEGDESDDDLSSRPGSRMSRR